MSDAIAFRSRVVKVEQKIRRDWIKGVGERATFEEVNCGWYVLLEGSHEAFYVGYSRPNVEVGDRATVRIMFDGRE